MAFNVPEEEKPEFNKKVQSGLNLFAKDVQRTLGQLEVLQPQTLVEAYNQPVQAPIARDLTPLEQYVYEPQPVPEVGSLTEMPARDSMVVPQEQPQVVSNFANQADAQFDRDMVSITPYEQAVTDVIGAEVDSLRNDAGEIAKSPLEVFSKPLNANSVRALGLVDQDGNPTERGQLFYNLQQSGMFNDDGTINEKGQAYLTPIGEMENPEWFQQPGSKEKFDILWEDGVIRSSSTPGEILSNVTKFAGDAVYGGAELAQQQAMGLAYNSRTWGGLLGMEDSRPDYLKARGEATELSIAENMYKNVIQTSNLIDVGLASDRQFIDESIMSPLYGALEKITGIQRPQPQEIDQANANIKNSKDALVAARYQQWVTDQRLANMEAGEIGETVLGIDNAVQKAEAAKQELGDEEFNKVYGRVGAFTNIAGDPTNVIPAAFAVKASRAVPLASRTMLNAQKTMGNIAAMDIAIAQGNTAVQASRAALAKVEPTVNLAQRMAANFAEGAKTQPALLERSAKASQIANRVTAEANQIRSTLPTITSELDNLITKRNSLATRIPEAYSQKVLQTMELGRQMRAMPAKAVGATLERVGDTISKTDTAVTNFLQERGLDQMYTAAVGAAGVVGLAGNPIIGALGAGAAALKTGKVLSNYGKLFRYVGKEMENVRGQIPFWKRVAAHTAPGSLGRGFAHTFNMLDLGGVTSDTLRRTGRGIAAAAPTDLMFEYLSDGADMRPETMYQAAAESLVIGGSFAAAGGAFMGTKKRMRELSIGDELNFRRNLTDTRQKALFEAIPAGTRRAISTYAIANPTLNYTFKDSGASRYDPNTNTAVINVKSTNPIQALVAHETLHHTVIKNNMEPGISALFLGDTKNNTVGGLFRSRDGKLDPNFEAFRDGYYKRLGVEGMSNAERDAIYPLDKIAVEYFIEKHADQYAAMAESGELGAVASSGAARRKLGSILETVLPRIPVLKDLHFKSGGMIDKNGAWVTGNGILDAEGVKRDPITNKMFRDMNRRSAGLVPGQFDPLMSDKPDSGAPILLNPSDSIDAELLHPLVQVDDANKPIMKDGKPVALDRATELSRALAGLTAKEILQRKRAENYAPEKGEAHVDDEGQFQPGWLSNDVLTEMFAKNKYNQEQKRIIREMNKLIRKGAGDRVVMINFPATTRNKAGKVVYKPQGATLRDTVPVAVTISKDGNLLFGLMSVTKLHENIQKRSQDRRGKKLYGGNVDLILRDTQAMMDYHKQGVDSIEFFKQKYGAVEADERKKFINTMFGLLNQKEQAVLNPILLEDGVKSRDNVYRTYRADRVSKAVPMSPDEYPAMPFSYEAVSAVRMPEQRQMPEVSPEDINPVANKQEAQGLWADGKRMFALNEMDEKLTPITSKAMLDSYSADAIGWMEPEAKTRFMPEPVPVAKTSDEALQESESGELQSTGVDVPESVDEQSVISNAIKVANSQSWRKGRDFKLEIQRRVLDAAEKAGVKLSERSLESIEYLARVGLKDALIALEQNPNAIGWYDEKTKQALGVMSLMFPEIATDQNARFAFTWALAVTSNGLKVDKNFELAERVYREYRNTGKMPTNIQAGQAQKAINKSLDLFNQLIGEWGIDNTRQFMQTDFTVGEIARLGVVSKTDKKEVKPGGEHSDTIVRGSAILGPKIGNGFFSNLYGLFDALTMDRWLVRTWGRWTGTLVELNPELTQNAKTRLEETQSQLTDSEKSLMDKVIGKDISQMTTEELAFAIQKASMKPKLREAMNATAMGEEFRMAGNGLAKYLDGQKEAPANPAERNFIREIFGLMLDELRADPKYKDLTMADLQAVLWYAEKRLYETAKVKADQDAIDSSDADGYEDDEAPDYANAAIGVARKNGVPSKRINEVLEKIKNDGATITQSSDEGRSRTEDQQQKSAGGFAGKQKQQFKQYVSVSRVRRNRTGNEKALWSYQTRSGVDSGDTGVLKPKAKKNLGVKYISEWKPGRKLSNTFRNNGLPVVKFLELDPSDQVSAKKFADTIQQSKDESPHGAAVYVYPVEDYQGMKLFLSDSGKSGFAVKPDGDIVSVFSMEKGSGRSIMEAAISAGGKKLDAFDTILPEFYGTHGFVEAARIPWNDEFAPDGWDKNAFKKFNNGEPDVVMMVLDPSLEGEYQPRTDIYTTDYDQAVEMQNAMLKKAARSRPKKASADIQKPTATPNQSAPKKPARKSQAKGNASAIANAAKLK
jgi:hypothetical protein